MKKVDENRRNTLKGMAAFSALTMFGNTLNAGEVKKLKTLVLVSNSEFCADFAKGVNKVESNINHIKKIDLIKDYVSFDSLIKECQFNDIKKITGLLSQSDYILLVERLKGTGINLKAEIFHTISEAGTKHSFSVTNTASGVISNSKTILESNNDWASSIGFILSGTNTNNVVSFFNKNGFKEATIEKSEKGDTKLVSFLATINKEIKNV